ncbi:aldo/keto reductase family oxidoreductase [uncultured Levyella sp.]|uniref:aldo/keto reductase n=1 Tax=uncultured Levyella sp. TaxID=1715800 RepID=UPI002586FA5A|nr:aldo/keto reductase [uncultured Levyella sp.]
MNRINLPNGLENVSRLILGCMRIPDLSIDKAAEMVKTSMDLGINFFDNATCYTDGVAEERFGEAWTKAGIARDRFILQTKCGLCFDRNEFDWRRETILSSVDDSLRRMKTDYLDILLLHRPDLLYEPEEVAAAFDALEKSGKVRHFGVSNVPPMMLEVLKHTVKQPLIINQLQLSLEQSQLIDAAFYMNNLTTERSIDRDNGLLDYCRLHNITIQAWSPLQYGMFGGCFIDDPKYPELNAALAELAEKYHVTKAAIALAWILRHPAQMQVIVGTMNPRHLEESAAATQVSLTHHEWYQLYLAAGKFLP